MATSLLMISYIHPVDQSDASFWCVQCDFHFPINRKDG